MVKNVKHHLKREVPTTKSDIKLNITTFLTTYRNIPHTVTNQAPADLILKQTPRTRLSLTSPNINLRIKTQLQSKSHQQKEAKTREFCVDDPVLVRDLLSGQPTKWQTGTVTEVLGGPRYLVNLGGEHTREAHADHLQPGVRKDRPSVEPTSEVSEQLPDSSPIPPPRRSQREKVQQKRLLEAM